MSFFDNKKGRNKTGGQRKYNKRSGGEDVTKETHRRQKKGGNKSKKW